MKFGPFLRWALAAAMAAGVASTGATPAAAQQRGSVKGTVRDAGTQQPVAGVQVLILDTRLQTTSDAQGHYEITGVPAGGAQVRVRAPGYSSALATTMVPAGQAVSVDFALNASVISLDEVVVTGAGTSVEKKQLGNTIATVKADALKDAPVADVSEALAAREAGVDVLPTGGLAGEGARIRIRGNASLSQSNQPVVYVDGVRVNNGGGFGDVSAGGAGDASRLDDINPEQIDHIEILKGAAAATLYGSEASAGVIQIFTKQGTQGRPKFSFRVDQGMSAFPKNRMQPQAGFARTQAQADRLQAIFGSFATTQDGGPITPYNVFSVPTVTEYYSTGYSPSYSGDVSGGGTDATYNVAARYASDLSPFHPTTTLGPGAEGYDRKVQTSANVTMFPRERLSIASGMMYTDTRHIAPANANNIYGVQSLLLNSKPEAANCQASIDAGLGGTYGQDTSNPGHCAGAGNEWGDLAFGTPREAGQEAIQQNGEHFNGNVHATYEPLVQQLKFDATFGIDVTDELNTDYRPFGYNVDQVTTHYVLGYKAFSDVNNREITADIKGNWNAKLGSAFTSQLVFGTQGNIQKRHTRYGRGFDFPGPGLQVSGAGANQSVDENYNDIVNIGLLGQEQIGYNDWAFFTVGTRWDRNSAFGENTSGAIYPKFSGSIVFSDMPGWSSTLLSTFRIRGAWGKSGLQPGAFDKFTTFGPLPAQNGPGIGPVNLGNNNLKPEVTREWEAGSEIAFFNNRLGFDVTYWDRRTTDALVAKQYPPSGGFTNLQLTNIGTLGAHGWDVKVNATVIDKPGFGLDLFANGAYLFQKIISMGGAAPIKVGGSYPRYRNYLKEGYAPGALFGAQILQPCGQTQYSVCLPDGTGAGTTDAAYYPYDVNGDGQPDTKAELLAYLSSVPTCGSSNGLDCFNSPTGIGPLLDDNNANGDFLDHYLGKPTPDWQGSLGANFRLGSSWSINTLFEYKVGNYRVSDLTDAFRESHPAIGRNFVAAAQTEALLDNPASTPDQRLQALVNWAYKYKSLSPYSGLNLTQNGDFMRFREIGVTYTAPQSFAQKFGLRNLSFNAAGRNVMLWTGYTGIDPEANAVGVGDGSQLDQNYLSAVDAWGFPLPRSFTFSVRLGF
jgi:TonB-dependent starch-binding outer membrane protein SusC